VVLGDIGLTGGRFSEMNKGIRHRSRLGNPPPAKGARGVRAEVERKLSSTPYSDPSKPVTANSDTISLQSRKRELSSLNVLNSSLVVGDAPPGSKPCG